MGLLLISAPVLGRQLAVPQQIQTHHANLHISLRQLNSFVLPNRRAQVLRPEAQHSAR